MPPEIYQRVPRIGVSLVIRRLFLITFFAMTFRTFQFFPGMAPIQEAWFCGCLIYLLTVYPFFKAETNWLLSRFELYVLGMMCLVPLLSGFSAWQEFGQPFTYGLLSQRSITLLGGVLFLIQGLRCRFFTMMDIEKSLIAIAWGVATLHLTMRALLNPAAYVSYGPGFVTGFAENASFVLPFYFPVFGFFYYAFLGFKTRRLKYYGVAGLFAFTLMNTGGARALTLALLAAFLFLVYRWGGIARATMLSCRMVLMSALIFGATYVVNPQVLSSRGAKFVDAFTVAFTGKEVEDVSANARIFEALLAASHLPQHPWLGNGNISNQWRGGNQGVLGEYFHPSDIGLIGALYVYGAVGLSLFAWQYSFVIKPLRRIPAGMQSPLLDATKGVLLFIGLVSITAGVFVFAFEVNCMFIALLRCTVIGSAHIRKLPRTTFATMGSAAIGPLQ
jgi:hypothetical protein